MKRSHYILMSALLFQTVLPLAPVSGQELAYVGSAKCKMCHLKEFNSWSKTNMAMNFELLKPGVRPSEKTAAKLDPAKDYTADPECLPCHTTGYGKPGGFVSLKESPNLVGVGCEMCHGPGSEYLKPEHMSLKNKEYKRADLEKVGLVAKPTVETCQQCHNTDSPFVGDDYVFDFEARKVEGTHEKFPLKYEH